MDYLLFWLNSIKSAFTFSKENSDLLLFVFTIVGGLGGWTLIEKSFPKFVVAIQDVPLLKTEKSRLLTMAGLLFFAHLLLVGPYSLYQEKAALYNTATNSLNKANEELTSIGSVTNSMKREYGELKEKYSYLTNKVDAFAIATGLTNLAASKRIEAFFEEFEKTKNSLGRLRIKADPTRMEIATVAITVFLTGKTIGPPPRGRVGGKPGIVYFANAENKPILETGASDIVVWPDGTNNFGLNFTTSFLAPGNEVIGSSMGILTNTSYIQIDHEYLQNNLLIHGGKATVVLNGSFLKTFTIPSQSSISNSVFIRNIEEAVRQWLSPDPI